MILSLRQRLANLERFINESSDLDPLGRMAVAHYHFEAIHPFRDGNGRVDRILNILMLLQCGAGEVSQGPVMFTD